MPLLTAGEDSPTPCSTAYFHSTLPSARLRASRCPDPTPTNTRPSAIAAEDSTASPASCDQATFSVGERGPAATPARVGPPRNCGHVSGAGAWAAAAATHATKTEIHPTAVRRWRTAKPVLARSRSLATATGKTRVGDPGPVRSCLTMPSRRFLAPRVHRTGAD